MLESWTVPLTLTTATTLEKDATRLSFNLLPPLSSCHSPWPWRSRKASVKTLAMRIWHTKVRAEWVRDSNLLALACGGHSSRFPHNAGWR